ncbi:MAG: carbamoyltransferase HypF [Betaproteobacteria bacterium RIFCSPLOWO2_02_FULL_62_17]|nr:MAG: carbamoyltransferase HypF [Betaproteobacteria bacterium RIFCSPLOWO2_02_FULL_62_17]
MVQLSPPVHEVRRHVRVRGSVQGVGFRPFIYGLASELALAGWVRNDGHGVEIEVQGEPSAVQTLVERIGREAPRLAHIASLDSREAPLQQSTSGFVIAASGGGQARTGVTPDAAVCADCLEELFDPAARRYRHAFISCTNCGPRYTITERLPYDRPNTSMAAFPLCRSCREEYETPADRRFHAQPIACPQCGPRLSLLGAGGTQVEYGDPFAEALRRLARGEIVAIKGLGGFHLACDARNADAVTRLRERKAREEKPFAVMLANVASAQAFAEVPSAAADLLESVERPIVLVRKLRGCDAALAGIAPGLAWLGVMLPYTPMQYLLFHQAAHKPAGTAWLGAAQALALVMTSANPDGEPIACATGEALERLGSIADAYLLHDYRIVTPCDDSVVRCGHRGARQFLRRARAYTPRPIALAHGGAAVLALGGRFNNTLCLTRNDEAFVSQHVGDLDNAATCRALEETLARLAALLEIEPQVIACDLHPDFHSSRVAARIARERGLPLISVQHHHAHIAAVAAEHGHTGPLIGLALDGVGLGTDGAAWGGELLRMDGARFERLGHLVSLRLPGGDRAASEPWRMAAAALHALGRTGEISQRYDSPAGAAVARMLERRVLSPSTSSCGRWFDAASGLLGIKDVSAFEGQAAMLLEGAAERHGPAPPLPGGYTVDAENRLDLRPLIAYVAQAVDSGQAAAVFHATLAAGLAQWAADAAARLQIQSVALSGGCFANRVLASAVRSRLEARGLRVIEAEQVPPGDGGLSLGQAWVALLASQEN